MFENIFDYKAKGEVSMNTEMKKEKISVPKCAIEVNLEERIELDVNLPDYCSDIKRVLRCFVTTGINSTEIAGDRLSVKGEITVRILYVGEDGKIDCCEQSTPLSKYADAKNIPENPILVCDVKTLYINSRASSQRRFTLSGNLLVNFKVFSVCQLDVCTAVENDALEVKCASLEAVTKCALGEKTFDMSETVSVDDDKKVIGRIIYSEAVGEISSVKTVNGKVLIKGDMNCKILYLSDTKEKTVECITHSMPINQIIEVSAIQNDYTVDVLLNKKNILIGVKTDSSGANKLLEIALKVCALVTGTQNAKANYIEDAFNKEYESKLEFDNKEFMCFLSNAEKKQSVNSLLDLSSQSPKEIIDVRAMFDECSYSLNNGNVEFKVTFIFSLIFIDEKGKIQYAQRNVDTTLIYELNCESDKLYFMPNVNLENLSTALQGDKLNVRYDVKISGNIYALKTVRLLENAQYDETKPKSSGDSALTVYYSSKGEKVWDIAKRYNTCEKSIKEENSLDCDTIKADMMLII